MSRKIRISIFILVALPIFSFSGYSFAPNLINMMMPADSRPGKIDFAVERLSPEQFEVTSAELTQEFAGKYNFDHIEIFRQAGITSYDGPKTCLQCHKDIDVKDAVTGNAKRVDLMENLLTSAHFQFFTTKHSNVYGFNGELADDFPMGKVDRPCPKPGSFAFTAWAELIESNSNTTLSEGCGQCHIGGQYQVPLGELMPMYRATADEEDAVDCLICHSAAYDMNRVQVAVDPNGYKRWDQDRSLKAALAVTRPTSQDCLRCHQHNFGGDLYIDQADPSFMQSIQNLGQERPRIQHPGSKRGTPFSPSWDVHAAAGVSCIDCHTTEGHYIAKGTHTTTMMTNDLPNVEVSCEKCHTDKPHPSGQGMSDYLNNHVDKIACQTCHIPSLHPDNVAKRDFSDPVYEEQAGIYIYNDISKETAPGKGIEYAWWNGDATFLGNPIGDNPNGKNLYRFYQPTNVWPEFKDFDYASWYERVMRPIAQRGRPSKIYPMKVFNGKQHIDLGNISPFGGMYVPYNFPTYYPTGDAALAARKEAEKPMMRMLYDWMFKFYLMDKFVSFMDMKEWNIGSYDDVVAGRNVEARWLPNDALLEISHSIRKQGAFTCGDCHSATGVLNWNALGYSEDEVRKLQVIPTR